MLFFKNMDKKKTFDEEKKELSAILNKHKIGDYTSEEETTIITSFFRQYHPEWYEKTKCMEVVKYNIISNNHHCRNGRCFELELSNGYKDDIGYGSLRKILQIQKNIKDSKLLRLAGKLLENLVVCKV